MKTLNKNDIQNVMDIQNLLSFDTYYTLLNENTNDEQKYKQAKREFIRRQSQLLITDGAEFICGVHKGSFRTNYQWDTINDKGVGRQCDVLPENFTFTDGFQILSIGTWQRIGSTTTFNDEYPLLFRSTIQITGNMPGNNPPETYNLHFTNAGQNFTYEDSIDEAYEQSIMGEKENNNKQKGTEPSTNCIVKFSLNENYDNLFGFDSYEMSQKGSNAPENLKKAYRSIDSLSEEYLIPWVRIGKYKYGKLVVTVEGNFTKITFNDPKSYFTFEPDTVTSKDQEVKITCNNIIKEEEYKVEVLADGKIAGGLMFLENSVKKLVIQPIYVTQNSDDGKNIDTFANNILLKQYFDKSFAPLLIQYTLESPFELNLDDPKWNQIPFQRNKVEKIKKTIGKGKRIIVKTSQENTSNDKRISLITDIAHLYQSTKGYEENPPYPLFFTYWECQKEDDIGNFIGSNNGITSSPSKYASMLFLANRDKIPSFDIPHEVLHGLGLEHTFDSKSTYTFIQGATQNYMDYKAQQMDIKDFAKEKHYTFKWQWDLVRISRWIEEQKIFLPIILLLLLLVSCKTYKNVSCEFDYFPTKDEMVLDSITYPLNQNISIGHKTYRNFKSSFNKNINYLAIDIDTLDVILTKYIDFNNGKIKLTNFTISKSRNIGKEYHFDENGNVTKVIDNDEGFAICWQQALFIAKKYAGKDAFEWMIGKDFYKKRNAWEIYYRKNKTPYFLVIDAQTGEIVRKGLRGGYVNDYIK
ncbi:PepSY domain-containing protein [Capnocytophaga sp.]